MEQQVKQAVQVAESLAEQYGTVVDRFMRAWQGGDDDEMSMLRAEIERVYAGIWEQLDQAAKLTRAANRSTAGYDALRKDPDLNVGAAIASVTERHVGSQEKATKTVHTFELAVEHNARGRAFARDAATAIKSVWPEVDFTPAKEPDVDLRPRGLLSRLFGKR